MFATSQSTTGAINRHAPEALRGMRVVVVDDEPANVRLLARVLGAAGYTRVETTTDSCEAVDLCLRDHDLPDLVLLDLMMPHIDGFGVMEQLFEQLPAEHYLPVLMLTADIAPATRNRALSVGAKDFLTKPFDATEVLLRIHNLLEVRALYANQQEHNRTLESRVRARTRELEQAQLEVLERLARAAECRDDDTGQHANRVGAMAARIGKELGLPFDDIEQLRHAAPLHDVGKIGVSDLILLKPGKLTPDEFAVMRTHAEVGAHLLAGSSNSLMRMAETIARSHHEKWDGSGYPHNLQGEAIPLAGRIVALCDIYDALTHERPYKAAWPREDALREIENLSGRHLDPQVVQAFLKVVPR